MERTDAEELLRWAGLASRRARERLQSAAQERDEAILDAYEKGISTAEIMEITGLSQPNVSRAKRRARKRRA